MEDTITKDDLRQFGLKLMDDIRLMIKDLNSKNDQDTEWLKGRVVRKLMDMSASSLQSLRITGKVRFKKILGTYYYNRIDLQNLFKV